MCKVHQVRNPTTSSDSMVVEDPDSIEIRDEIKSGEMGGPFNAKFKVFLDDSFCYETGDAELICREVNIP